MKKVLKIMLKDFFKVVLFRLGGTIILSFFLRLLQSEKGVIVVERITKFIFRVLCPLMGLLFIAFIVAEIKNWIDSAKERSK